MRNRSAWALVVVVLLASCDLSTEFDGAGTFTATVSGDLSANMAGTALFGSLGDGQFSLVMTDPNGVQAVAVARDAGRPAPGTFTINHHDEEVGFIAAYARDGAPQAEFRSESGEIVITTSTNSRLEGSMTFEAVGTLTSDPDTELRITVTGNFDARCVQAGGTACQ